MLEEISLWPKKLADGLDIAHNFHFNNASRLPTNIKKIIFVGMGGSGIAGRVIKTFFDKKSKIPTFVLDSPELPAHIDSETLAIVVSYSGNTWETVSALESLAEKRIPIIALSHGGAVAEIAEERNIPFVLLPESKMPRSALGNFLSIMLGLLDLMGFIDGKSILAEFNKQLDLYLPKFEEDAAYFNEFLDAIDGCKTFHVWGISGDSAAFAYRAQSQFNENSKMAAVTSYFPELNHNLLLGLSHCNEESFILFLGTEFISMSLAKSVEIVSQILKKRGIILYKPPILGDTWEGQLFHIILWADFASYHLGKSKGVDTEEVGIIEELKKRLKERTK